MTADLQDATAPEVVTEALVRRFWSKVWMGNDSECWLWKGTRDRYGYGQFSIGNHPYRAHRVAYWMWNGRWFAPAVKLRHSCDTRYCCNPSHLQPGTQADNMQDRKAREGYRTMARGERHGLAKLSAQDALEIRDSSGDKGMARALATKHGVSEAQISRIRRGRAWEWLPKR